MEMKIDDLFELIELAEVNMRRHRNTRTMLLEAYCGTLYTGQNSRDNYGQWPYDYSGHGREPINLHWSLVSALLPNLSITVPKNLVSTQMPELMPVANMMGLDLDHLYDEIEYGQTIRLLIVDALVGAGIVKTALGPGKAISPNTPDEPLGYLHDLAQPFSDRVSYDDYGIDPTARTREEAWFEYDTYRLPLAHMKKHPKLYDQDAVEKLEVHHDITMRRRAESLSKTGRSNNRQARDILGTVDVRDVWLPKEGLVVTVPAGREAPAEVLREVKWTGPERGPYEMLGFAWCPDNALPVPLMGILHDLHVLQNKLAAKAGRQADRSKTVVLADSSAEQDAQTVRDSGDGDVVMVNGLGDKFQQVTFGGATEDLYRHMQFTEAQYSQIGGNIELIGGLGAKSETLGQDQLLQGNIDIRVNDSRTQLGVFLKRNAKKLGWYLWTDPKRRVSVSIGIPGIPEPLQRQFGPEDKEGDFADFVFDIDVYSMGLRSPVQMYNQTLNWITQVAGPLAPAAQQQGLALDVAGIVKLTSSQLNQPELANLLVPVNPIEPAPAGTVGVASGPRGPNVNAENANEPAVETQSEPGRELQPA
jgi:hypothetical protein